MTQRPSGTLANAVAHGVRVTRIEPLQNRIARNKRRFATFMVIFTTAIAAGVALTFGLGLSILTLLVVLRFGPTVWSSPAEPLRVVATVIGGIFAASFVVCWAWSLIRISRAEHLLVERLEARVPKAGTLLPTRSVLRDMALAAGLEKTPTLYVIDTPRVNAFVVGRTPERVRVGVTRGLLERIPPDEQRAVFANLIARVLSADTLWATAVSALMGPIWAWRDRDLADDPRIIDEVAAGLRGRTGYARRGDSIVLGGLLTYGIAVVISEFLSYYHQEAAWSAAEKADAEGMMLLKDPRSMLRAIEHVLERNNHVPTAGDAYSQLFFCWAGFGFAAEDDPEMRRVARLRETLGAEGAAYTPRPNVPGWPVPVAPRIELAEDLFGAE